jgi:hypothetical protein
MPGVSHRKFSSALHMFAKHEICIENIL